MSFSARCPWQSEEIDKFPEIRRAILGVPIMVFMGLYWVFLDRETSMRFLVVPVIGFTVFQGFPRHVVSRGPLDLLSAPVYT